MRDRMAMVLRRVFKVDLILDNTWACDQFQEEGEGGRGCACQLRPVRAKWLRGCRRKGFGGIFFTVIHLIPFVIPCKRN